MVCIPLHYGYPVIVTDVLIGPYQEASSPIQSIQLRNIKQLAGVLAMGFDGLDDHIL